MIWQFIAGFVVYSIMATASYSSALKQSPWFYAVGILCAAITNSCWFSIARSEPDASKLVVYGMWWDALLTIIYLLVPILFFAARPNLLQSIGIGVILLGIAFTKAGS